jgi:hypothetical protein
MRRQAFVAAFAVASFLALAASAGGTHSDGNGPKKDLVAGTGTLVVPTGFAQDPMLHVNADRDAVTGEVHGHWFVRYPTTTTPGGFEMRGRVVCLDTTVVGHAGLVGQIERVKEPESSTFGALRGFVENNFVYIRVRDLGEPGTLDGANFDTGTPTQPFGCPPGTDELPLSQGNYIVHSDPPLEILSFLELLLAEFEAAAGEH